MNYVKPYLISMLNRKRGLYCIGNYYKDIFVKGKNGEQSVCMYFLKHRIEVFEVFKDSKVWLGMSGRGKIV
jgi:hypothetical protein